MKLLNEKYILVDDNKIKKIINEIDDNTSILLESVLWGICSSDAKSFACFDKESKFFGHEMVLRIIASQNVLFPKGDVVVPLHSTPLDSNLSLFELSYQKYFCVNDDLLPNLVKVNSNEPHKYVFLDSICCVIHAINKLIKIGASNSHILILGNGFISILFQKVFELKKIKYYVKYKNKINNKGKSKFDVCIDTTGCIDYINAQFEHVNINGCLLLFANTNFANLNFTYIRDVNFNLIFSKYFDSNDLKEALSLLNDNKLDINSLISWYSGTESLSAALNDLANKRIVRGIVKI